MARGRQRVAAILAVGSDAPDSTSPADEVDSIVSSESRFETAAILLRAGQARRRRRSSASRRPRAAIARCAALHAGILTKREWRWGEKIRAVEVLSDLLTWLEGDYTFDRGAHARGGGVPADRCRG